MRSDPIITCTSFFRKQFIEEYIYIKNKNNTRKWHVGDLPIWIFYATKGNCCNLKDYTATYRVLEQSASHGNYMHCITSMKSTVHLRLSLNRVLGVKYPANAIISRYARGAIKKMIACGETDYEKIKHFKKLHAKTSKSTREHLLFSIIQAIGIVSMLKHRLWNK